jgi:hypothetical protein
VRDLVKYSCWSPFPAGAHDWVAARRRFFCPRQELPPIASRPPSVVKVRRSQRGTIGRVTRKIRATGNTLVAVAVQRLRALMYFALRRRLLVVLALMVATDSAIGGMEPHVGGFVAGILIAAALWPRTENRFNIRRPTLNVQH